MDHRVPLVACCPRRERAEQRRDADAQRQAFRINAGHEVDEDVPLTVPMGMVASPVTVRPRTRGGSSGMPVSV